MRRPSFSLKTRAYTASVSGWANVQCGRASASARNSNRFAEIAEMCPHILAVAKALESSISDVNKRRKILESLYHFSSREKMSDEECMFIHLVRFRGLESALIDAAFGGILRLQRLLRAIGEI